MAISSAIYIEEQIISKAMEKTVQITARFVDPGLASHALQVAESDTVDDLRRQLLAHGVVKRGTSFGLKMSGKRKQV